MARAIWTGSLSFGLVNVPVGLFSATEDKSIHFNQFQAGTNDRVRNKRVNEQTGEEVPYNDIVKGYDLGGGEYVVLTPEEISSAAPGRSKTIDVTAFVELSDIDPVYFDKPYYLAPPAKSAGKGAERAYSLLREAMLQSGKVALASFVMREKQYLVAIRPTAEALVMETLLYADEVRDPVEEIDSLPVDAQFDQRELDMAKMLVDTMTAEWDPEQYHDTFREQLEQMIEAKRSGAIVALGPPTPEAAPVVDLLAALEASLKATRGQSSADADAAQAQTQPGGGSAGLRAAGATTKRKSTSKAASAPTASAAAEDPSAMDKATLSRRAADLGVVGRSKMTRDELEAAVRAAAEPVRKRKAS